MPAVPADAHALALFPVRDAITQGIDAPRDFVAWHTGILKSRPQTVFDEDIAVADATRVHFHANLSGARLGNVAFNQLKIPTGFTDLCSFHFRIFYYSVSACSQLTPLLGRLLSCQPGDEPSSKKPEH